jgi:GNAT superfamily N-acetyltransferase
MIEIRHATIADAPGIAEVHVATWRSAYKGLMPDAVLDALSIAQRTERWQRTIPYEPVVTFVAERDGRIVGFASGGQAREDESGTIGELYTIYVLEEAAGQGIGTRLLTATEELLHERGFTSAVLWVLASNAPSRAFYAARGWIDDGIAKTEISQGAEVVEARYSKVLKSLQPG